MNRRINHAWCVAEAVMLSRGCGILCLSGALLISVPGAETTVYSDPVALTRARFEPGNHALGVPLVHPVAAAGEVRAIEEDQATGRSILGTERALVSNRFDAGPVYPRCYLEITGEGAAQGCIFDIVSNAEEEIVVEGMVARDFGIGLGTAFVIREHLTLRQVFAGAVGLTPYVDSIKVSGPGGASMTLFWDGSRWTPDFVSDHSDRPVDPGRGILAAFNGEVECRTGGALRMRSVQIAAFAGELNLVAPFFPLPVPVGDLNLVTTLTPWSENIKTFQRDGTLAEAASYFTDGARVTRDFVNDHGAEPVEPWSAMLLNVAENKYWMSPTIDEGGAE